MRPVLASRSRLLKIAESRHTLSSLNHLAGLKGLIASLVVAVCVVACGGGGKSQANIAACWNHSLATYAHTYAAQGNAFGGQPSAQLVQTSHNLLVDTAALYEAGHLPSGDTTPAITARFKAIQATCGHLKVSKK